MNWPLFLFDIAPELGAFGAAAIVGFFLIFAAVAYVAFRLLRKTVKMAFRLAIVAAILLVALVGSLFIYWSATKYTPRPRPQPTRSR